MSLRRDIPASDHMGTQLGREASPGLFERQSFLIGRKSRDPVSLARECANLMKTFFSGSL